MLSLAQEAIKLIKNSSELKELWEETEDYNNWLQVVNDLEIRIQSK
ncbi:hypothetical protein J2Z66_006533 [Paenibacillus eucommiae]|uniref:Uncharacterized protein n=1 Tax=Paenibacillus eucommiae TaxID=1355755 RepID=A0ABS4J4Y2_9BACL|nr:hypothetical protein [Paenibacillus eucommiae]